MEALFALIRIEKRLEKVDGLFNYTKERADVKIILDCLLEYKKLKEGK